MVSRYVFVHSDSELTSFDAFLDEDVIALDSVLCSGQISTILHLYCIDRTASSIRFYYDWIANDRKFQLFYKMPASHVERSGNLDSDLFNKQVRSVFIDTKRMHHE